MPQEIERKFLVRDESYKAMAYKKKRIRQGYICSERGRTVRYEWEHALSLQEAEDLMRLCEPGMIDKTRYLVRWGTHVFEVDEFYGENNGLVVAEVELTDEKETFECPPFLGEEVTGQVKYYNSFLMKSPYSKWGENLPENCQNKG